MDKVNNEYDIVPFSFKLNGSWPKAKLSPRSCSFKFESRWNNGRAEMWPFTRLAMSSSNVSYSWWTVYIFI